MRVVRVINSREFEFEGVVSVGDFVRVGGSLAVAVEVYCEDPEILKYLGRFEIEELKQYLPDLAEPKTFTRCYLLFGSNVRVGESVDVAEEEYVKSAHVKDGDLYMPYIPELVSKYPHVAIEVVKKLEEIFPEHRDVLKIIKAGLEFSRIRRVDV